VKRRRGYAIPLSLVVAGVTLVLGMSAAQMSASDLNLASQQYYGERARQVADLGLEYFAYYPPTSTTAVRRLGSLAPSHRDDQVSLQIFDNKSGTLPANSGCPVEVPVGFEYWLATGQARSGDHVLAEARVGSLVRPGSGAGSAGAQIRYFWAPDNVTYSAIDGDNGDVIAGEAICASNVTEAPSSLPGDFLTLTQALTFNSVSQFNGILKLPEGAPEDQIVDSPIVQAVAADSGGAFSLPHYTPPSTIAQRGVVTVTSDNQLPAGTYDELILQNNTATSLSGTYHVRRLRVNGDRPVLQVSSGQQARVFVDEVVLLDSASRLNLQNHNGSARHFRLDLAPAAESSPPLLVKLIAEGKVMIIAPGRKLQLEGDSSNTARGAFFAEQLKVALDPGNSPKFIYDVSANGARQNGSEDDVRSLQEFQQIDGVTGGDFTDNPLFDNPTVDSAPVTPLRQLLGKQPL